CERFFGDFGRLLAALRDPAGDHSDPVRIASVSSFGRYVLFPVLARTAPSIRYTLRFPTAAEVFGALADGSCDLGFVYLPVTSSRIAASPVWREELVLIAPPGTRALPPRLEAYEDLPFVTYDESEYVFGHWFEAVYRRSPRTLRSAYAFEELEEVVATAASGRGWSIVPDHCVRGAVAVLRHARHRVHNTIYAVTRAGGPDHPARAQLLETLAAVQRRAANRRRSAKPSFSAAPRSSRRYPSNRRVVQE
ncbi:MAG TPA: substrate-binding domain-containing protein, partial [Kofleriaceae bacterium]|nr:substrate-binding domain-containing protein [Kofleriaceae bacterium]